MKEFEKLIFPPRARDGMTKLEAMKGAMKSYDQLFTEEGILLGSRLAEGHWSRRDEPGVVGSVCDATGAQH
jgi:hypothetical protein